MNNKNEVITMRDLITESRHKFYAKIRSQDNLSVLVDIPKDVEMAAANELLADRGKSLAWFGLDKTNTVSRYELSVNSQDILNGRCKNTKHFVKTCQAWQDDDEIEFCGIMYLKPYGLADFTEDDWWHLTEILRRYGFGYGYAAIGEISADGKSVENIEYIFSDFIGTMYTATSSDNSNNATHVFCPNQDRTEEIRKLAFGGSY